MKKKHLLPVLLILVLFSSACPYALATHLKGGEITHRVDQQNPLKVHIELTLYLNTRSPISEHVVTLHLGDGSTKRVPFDEQKDERAPFGEFIRIFRTEHVYANTGSYRIWYIGINRNEGVINLPNSIAHTLIVYTDIGLNPQVGAYHSPLLLAPPIMRAILGQPFRHNLTAYDPNGDSLAYELAVPMTTDVSAIQAGPVLVPDYLFPSQFSINARTGEIFWEKAGATGDKILAGEYAVAVRITKYRKRQVLCHLVRDFHIMVVQASFQPEMPVVQNAEALELSPENKLQPPLRQPLAIKLQVEQHEANPIRLTAYSELLLGRFPATFSTEEGEGSVSGLFRMVPQARHLRPLPYLITFRATYFYPDHPLQPVEQDLTLELLLAEDHLVPKPLLPTNNRIQIFPNPVRDFLQIDLPEHPEGLLVIYSLDGREVFRWSLRNRQNIIPRHPDLQSGVYLYSLTFPYQAVQIGKILLH
jgi:hypothetical protein